MSTEYARANTASNSTIWTDQAVSSPAITQMPCRELGGGAVNARSRVAVGAQRRGIARRRAQLDTRPRDGRIVTTIPSRQPCTMPVCATTSRTSRCRCSCGRCAGTQLAQHAADVRGVHVRTITRPTRRAYAPCFLQETAPSRANNTDTRNQGVSDPEGRGDAKQRARRGRSRLGSCRWILEAALQGRHKTPPHLRRGALVQVLARRRRSCDGFVRDGHPDE